MTGAGAEMIEEEGIIANEAPDADAQAACEAAGKAFSCKCINNIQSADHTTIIFNP